MESGGMSMLAFDLRMLTGLALFAGILWYLRSSGVREDSVAQLMRGLPYAGLEKTWFSKQRALFQSVKRTMATVAKGYNQFTRHKQLFVLPSLGSGTVVIMPPSQLNLLNRPEKEIGAWNYMLDIIQPRYTMGSEHFYETTINCAFNVVWKRLPRDFRSFGDIVYEEFDIGFREFWGTTGQWTTVNLFDSCARIVSRSANRTFFGRPLCYDKALLECTLNYASALFGSASLISILPPTARTIFGPAMGWPARRYMASCKKILMPVIAARLEKHRKQEPCPTDFLQWLIQEYQATQPAYMDEDHISQSLLVLNVMSIYGTTYNIVNSVLDLYSSKDCDTYVAGLREEAQMLLQPMADTGLGDVVTRMNRTDSCVRESLRLSSFHIVTLLRAVSHPQGVQLDGLDSQVSLPAGTRFGFPLQAIHRDESFYPDPDLFDAFRFSRPYEEQSDGSLDSTKQPTATTVGPEFLTWGYGRHACPGRMFATQMMKIALSYIVHHFDVEHIADRAKCEPMLNVLMPPVTATLKVRWRDAEQQ